MANSGIKVEVGDLVVNEHDAATADAGLYLDGNKVVSATPAALVADIGNSATGTEIATAVNGILAILKTTHGLMADA